MKKAAWLAGLVWALVAVGGCSSAEPTAVVKDALEDAGPTEDIPGRTADSAADLGTVDGAGLDEGDAVAPPDAETTDALDVTSPEEIVPDVVEPEIAVSTYSPASTVPAGIPLHFECKVKGLKEGTYVTYLQISGPSDVEVENLAVTFHKKGKYSVACRAKWNEGEVADPTPLKIDVQPGAPATVETLLSKNDVKAGETVTVTCTITDAYGNLVENPAKVAVNPDVGITVYGMKILGTKVGTYSVACVDKETGTADKSPELLNVSWGMPKMITTTLDANVLTAGETTGVTCKATDAFGNVVPDYPVVVFLSPGLFLQGFNVGGKQAGSYQVICVPQKDSWDLFSLDPKMLTVLPGAATGVSLQKVPDKPVYMMFESVSFIVTAVDDYGNLVEGVDVLPLTWDPDDPGIVQKGAMKYKLETEGAFVFSACLEAAPTVCGFTDVVVDGYGPVITIKYPERGATIKGKPAVNVTGNVVDPVSGVEEFSINGDHVPLDENGDFVYAISAQQGLNMLVAVAEDPNGLKTLLVQSFYYSPVWHKVDINDPEGSQIQESILFFLHHDFFNKLPHDYSNPGDLSTIVEMTLASLDIGSFLPNPVASAGPYKVYVGPFYYAPPEVYIDPVPEGILAEVRLQNIKVKVEAKGKCKVLFVDLCPDVSGSVNINSIEFWDGIRIWAEDGKLNLEQIESFIGIYGVDVHIDGILGFLFGWLVNWFVDGYVGELEKTAKQMVDEQIANIAGGMLDQLSLNQQLEVPNPLDPNGEPVALSLVSSFDELIFGPGGVEVRLNAAVLAPKNINKNPQGSIGRASCLEWVPETFVIDKEKFAVMALHDDLFNEVLFSAWYAGLLDMQLPVDDLIDPAALADFGIGSLEEMGIKDIQARTEFFLPPIITSCNDPWDDVLQLQVGDLYVELTMKMLNEPVTMGMFVSLAAEAIIEIHDTDAGQEISLAIGEIDPVVAQVTYISDNLKGAEGIMSMIVQAMLLPALLEQFSSDALASFPLPVIDVSNLAPQYLPPNISWKFVIDSFFRELGFTSLFAHIEVVK